MSSMRNAVSRRPHRERAQPAGREKWGLLEKHKDYSLRAQDYNLKKKKLSQLSQKAKDRHPDEFAYGMLSKDKARQGKHGRGGDENVLSHDAVKLLKSQDAGYLRVALGRGRKEMRKVEEEIGSDKGGLGKKVEFDQAEQTVSTTKTRNFRGEVLEEMELNEVYGVDVPGEDETIEQAEEVPPSPAPKPKSNKALAAERDAATRLKAERKKRRRLQETRAAKLEMLKKRQREIMAAADQLDLQRANMARTIGGVNKNGVKFKIRERKR